MSDEPSTLATALAFAKHGIASFSCWWPLFADDGTVTCACGRVCDRVGKHPHGRLAPKGCYSATCEVGVLKHQLGYICPEANLAIHAAGLVIVDVDPRHGGDESFAALEREHGALPKTWRVITGGGGHHDYYRAPDGAKIPNIVAEHMPDPPLGKGIDIRSRGGYVITPPSLHESGRHYAWSVDHHPKDTPLAMAPDWLVERLGTRSSAGSAHSPSAGGGDCADLGDLVEQEIAEYKSMAAVRLAGHLVAHHVDRRVIKGLLQNWNAVKVKAPKLRWGEIERIVDQTCEKEADKLEQAEREKQGN